MTDPHPRESLSDQIRRGALLSTDCPSREVLKRMTSLWGLLVLMILRDGTRRFSDLRRAAAGVSEKMLAQTLQGLEADGLIDRHAFPVIPPHVEYSLTPLGIEAAERVAALADWVEVNLPRVMEARATRLAAE
ncbi:helix-turn-helix transcriptional regulator [Azospirillum sp. RWY-5-1]|uniref:Helix-turn-helix transcriptional regulator n=1 Tax=Azospirillum oleiclasticum TaxID=2735135 RepID=A0ABX2T1S6_9PROT|nr:helix-turn-helix domain-containing protein [Azospirillum oleiclasticum]NYZ11107.1 helix-turn-helix transcriptional regulator [Azospirillum oleiclasticum]NYZ18269.1 helix-turn-helix transcriptional regulator [Azospirillum oleiclasticum]